MNFFIKSVRSHFGDGASQLHLLNHALALIYLIIPYLDGPNVDARGYTARFKHYSNKGCSLRFVQINLGSV